MAENAEAGQNDGGQTTWRTVLAAAVALVVLVVYLLFLRYMLQNVGGDEPQWSRSVYLFGGVEAIVFAAIGWVFGREVHRAQAESASARADRAADQAMEASKQAADQEAKGTALAQAIEAKAAAQPRKVEPYGRLGGADATTATQEDFNELAELARRLYPQDRR